MTMTRLYSLQSHERLKSKKLLGRLFEEGTHVFVYPFKVVYILEPRLDEEWPLTFAISIPKKKIRKAVQRNLLKRRSREAYRLNKLELQDQLLGGNYKLSLIFIYLESELKNYSVIEKSIKRHLNEVQVTISAL